MCPPHPIVAFDTQREVRFRHIVICGLSDLYRIFPHHLINGTIKKNTQKCVFWFSLQLLSEKILILRRTERDMIKNVYWSLCKVQIFLSDCNETWISFQTFAVSWIFILSLVDSPTFFLVTRPMKMEESVPKRRNMKLRHRGIIQRKNTRNLNFLDRFSKNAQI